ncbi:MAG TPA: helix-turn-helix domain-containing protein [Mesorhizobium sp.]|nr:helix-turn-helix domain-containing protein [Mesorhizobium sp.]
MDKISVTIKGATEISGLSRSRIYELFDEGKLTRKKDGSKTLILVSELKHFVESLPSAA